MSVRFPTAKGLTVFQGPVATGRMRGRGGGQLKFKRKKGRIARRHAGDRGFTPGAAGDGELTEIVGTAADGETGLELAGKLRPDLVIWEK